MMSRRFFSFSITNRRLLILLIGGWFLWSGAVAGLWLLSRQLSSPSYWWSAAFIFVQLYLAVQMLLPALLLEPEQRTRGFYLFWLVGLASLIRLAHQLPVGGFWEPLIDAFKTGLLLFSGTLVGIILARYVKRLWEVLPLALVMILADFSSWAVGPTADFARQIEAYYRAPEGPRPLIDMVLVKLTYPGASGLVPVFGISDWIIVVFFAAVARRYRINDNLIGPAGEPEQKNHGRYLPVSVVALFLAILLAHAGEIFIPALPLIVLIVVLYYLLWLLVQRLRGVRH
ncbi:hypothetical protein [Pelovirga terrestris]|uniref:Uncharacterized protein n=1 Tax=Pelovirga terrestris TaxID=2771352 RepID=A0A8J6UIJ7_9BACT|nr:hypothetical protein [Pelovirga terrestris]MBD1401070.1 hypothetical protein [Pelovirga terrestris]